MAGVRSGSPSLDNGSWPQRAYLTLVSLIALTLLFLEYHHGIGVTADSAIFISSADSLLHGFGLSTDVGLAARSPLTHYPPLYPLLLAAGKLITGDFLRAAELLNIMSFVASLFALCTFVRQNASRVAALAAGCLLVSSTALYSVHYALGTDGIAIPWMLASSCY